MNVALRLLAQTNGDSGGGTGANGVIPSAFLTEIDCNRIWECIGQISWLEAAVFIAFGFIYVLYGWRMFRALVVINFAAIGLYAGMFFGGQLGSALWGGLMGATLMSLFCWPFMKYSIAILGALAGGILGGALWLLIGLPQPLIWCGALAGLVAGGLLVFSSYKTSIMLFTIWAIISPGHSMATCFCWPRLWWFPRPPACSSNNGSSSRSRNGQCRSDCPCTACPPVGYPMSEITGGSLLVTSGCATVW